MSLISPGRRSVSEAMWGGWKGRFGACEKYHKQVLDSKLVAGCCTQILTLIADCCTLELVLVAGAGAGAGAGALISYPQRCQDDVRQTALRHPWKRAHPTRAVRAMGAGTASLPFWRSNLAPARLPNRPLPVRHSTGRLDITCPRQGAPPRLFTTA